MDKTRLLRYGVAAVILSAIFFFVFLRELTFVNLLDAITLTGICFLIIGLFRTAKYLHFYDLPIYGGKKFAELFRGRYTKEQSKVGEYYEYVQKLDYQVNFKEAYFTAAILLGAALIISMLCSRIRQGRAVLCFWVWVMTFSVIPNKYCIRMNFFD